MFDGYATEQMRDLLYSAADLAVLSFVEGLDVDSGTLADAIAWGVPVVCSARSSPAALVSEYDVGVVFEPGDEAALIAAVRAAPAAIQPAALARARHALFGPSVASAHLSLLR